MINKLGEQQTALNAESERIQLVQTLQADQDRLKEKKAEIEEMILQLDCDISKASEEC